MDDATRDQLKQAGDELKQAADSLVDRLIGRDARGHLCAATRHAVKAARSALDRVDAELAKREDAGKPPTG